MNPPREFRNLVEDLFYEIVDLGPREREPRLREITDSRVRREVESLLAAYDESDSVLKGLDQLGETPSGSTVVIPDRTGTRVGQYEITEKIGSGGMGVVYRAYDTRLERPVALKFLASAGGHLLDEARAASALDHPNIGVVHQVGEAPDGQLFMAMALYDGETLRERIDRGRLSVDEALSYALQIARGLAKAHGHGIIHRDVKPANVIVTGDGVAKIVDFGIAKIAGRDREGIRRGTVAYMSPEQLRGDTIDHRADLWALGVVLYEMLAGRPPFAAKHEQALVYSVLEEQPIPIERLRPDTPRQVSRLVMRALDKNPARRFASSAEMLRSLELLQEGTEIRSVVRLLRKPRITAAVIAGILILGAGILVPLRASMQYDRARALLLDIERLAEAGEYAAAYDLAVRAEDALGTDSLLARWWPVISDSLTVLTEPEGAQVFLQRFGETRPRGVGTTPIAGMRVARADYRIRIVLEGFAPFERMAGRGLTSGIRVQAILQKDIPEEMVYVPGGAYRLVAWSAPTREEVHLGEYLIDRYEVSNRDFKDFVDAGGYRNRAYWGPWEEVAAGLVDRSGRPGPRGWVNGTYPEGAGKLPVTGITWYEASAYARYRGKRLPTIFEWEKAARDGAVHPYGIVMPWGLQTHGKTAEGRANFDGRSAVGVDANPFGVSPYGAYNMAGNVKEWCLNALGDGRATIGGSWQDPQYLFAAFGSLPALHASSAVGFRCVRSIGTGDQGEMAVPLHAERLSYTPVDDRTYESFLSHYRYDRSDLGARIAERREFPGWMRETIRFGGDLLAYLYLPRDADPPYQTIVFAAADPVYWGIRSASQDVEEHLAGLIEAGRAVMTVVPKGGLERPHEADHRMPPMRSVAWRELVTLWASEISRGIDYLESRTDIDLNRLAYFGVSAAGPRTIFAAIEPRYRAIVLMGAGINSDFPGLLPEVNAINFAPRIARPTLLINGRYDEIQPVETNVHPLFDLLREPKQMVLVEGGHVPAESDRTLHVNRWLDETMGAVR